ncbi:MAG: GNAT family N-acetyltransferase [Actinomycetota bacterium]|nr:GNAT family N-acetyltransferase [Actinomycetota bacterium]
MVRYEYLVTRETHTPLGRTLAVPLRLRQPTANDRLELATLMMDSYVGTIDYEGETYEQAVVEVDEYLAAEALLDVSQITLNEGVIQSAVLMSRVVGTPLVGYVMTRADLKNRGIASALLDIAIEAVWATDDEEVRAFITEGNLPSETIFERAGFRVIGSYG